MEDGFLGGPEEATPLTLFEPDADLETRLIPMEINLEGWPLFSRRKTPEGGAMEVRRSLSTPEGRRLEQVWRITSSHDFSLPGTFDEDIFVGVMALVRQRGGMPQDGKIRFSLYELIKVLRKKKRGSNYPKVRDSLDRMASTIYYSENAFYDASEGESLETYRFALWTIHYSRAKGAHGRAAEHHTLKFDDAIIRSYNAGYLKLLDTDLYFALKLPLAKALYRLVDQRRAGSASWSVDARDLRDLLMMSDRYKAPSRIWEVLAPAHRALRAEKYLESALLDGDTVCYKIHPNFAQGSGYPERDGTEPTLEEEAVEALVRQGVWANRARTLVGRFGPEKAFHALDVLEARHSGIGNRGAYLAEVMEKADPEDLSDMAEGSRAPKTPREAGSGSGAPPNAEQGLDAGAAILPEAAPGERRAAEEVWPKVLEAASEKIDAPAWQAWFEGVEPRSLLGGALILLVPNSFAKEYIEERFKDHLQDALGRVLAPENTPPSVECVVESAAVRDGR